MKFHPTIYMFAGQWLIAGSFTLATITVEIDWWIYQLLASVIFVCLGSFIKERL